MSRLPPPSSSIDNFPLVQAIGAGIAEGWKAFTGLKLQADALSQLQNDYVRDAAALWNHGIAPADAAPPAALSDRRFAAGDWMANRGSSFVAQMYLLNARTMMKLADSVDGDAKTRERIRFAVQQWVEAASPSNFLAFNPEAQRMALQTQGESIAKGLRQLWRDVQQGHVSQTDESQFEVGRNVGTSEGMVVFENELFQLIEYKPLTSWVYERPLLFVPPCINKYYILDLQPDNSLVRYAVEQGFRVFMISWRNPDDSLAAKTWDDYVGDAVIGAIDQVQSITGQDGSGGRINMLGFCVGGTILASALSVLAARGRDAAASVTLLTTFLDFDDTGVLDVFVDETSVRMRELTIGAESPGGGALLKGSELAGTFSFLRPNDLVWNYVVGNYLKGESPPAFDLLFWNSDSTNLPGPMYCWYLRHAYLENALKVPGQLQVLGEPLDFGRITAPTYLYASRDDHIVPWASAYRSVDVLTGVRPSNSKKARRRTNGSSAAVAASAGTEPLRFVLGASGHIAGVINPPAKKKRSHWVAAPSVFPATADEWLVTATERPGSWWTDWSAWLKPHGGRQIAAPMQYGDASHPAIEPAPGRYVKAKA